MEWYLMAFIAGNLAANVSPIVLSSFETGVAVVILLVLFVFKYKRLAILMLGAVSVFAYINHYNKWSVTPEFQGENITITGDVVTAINKKKNKISFNFVAKSLQGKPLDQVIKLRLTWYYPDKTIFQGDDLKLTVRLKPINGLHNELGFDYQKWLISEHIQALGYIKKVHEQKSQSTLFGNLRQVNLALTQDMDFAGILLALSSGIKTNIKQDRWTVIKQTGTAHLMVISGLHLGLVFSLVWLIFNFGFRFLSFSLRRFYQVKPKPAALLCSLLCAWFFCVYSGSGLPAIRACLMLSVFVFFSIIGQQISGFTRLLVAAVVILVYDPFSLLSLSFLLSFTVVACLIFAMKLRPRFANEPFSLKSKWMLFLYLQLCLLILLTPVQWLLLSQFNSMNFFANLVAIPVMSLLIIPLLMLALLLSLLSPGLAHFVYHLADILMTVLWPVLEWCFDKNTQLDFAFIQSLQWGLIIVVCCFVLSPFANRWRSLLVLSLLPLCLVPMFGHREKPFWTIDMIDVGQGLAIMVADQHNAVLYDTGAGYSSGFNFFDAVILPLLKKRHLNLQVLILSHNDNDHVGGMEAAQQHYPDLHILQSQVMAKQGAHIFLCQSGQSYHWLGLVWQVVSPVIDVSGNTDMSLLHKTDNNQSCVLKVSDANTSLLLTGDIEDVIENQILSMAQVRSLIKNTDLATVAHHGSKTSSSREFLKQVNAKHWLLSRGRYNRFKHPDGNVMSRLNATSGDIWDTAYYGQVSFKIRKAMFNKDIAHLIDVKTHYNHRYLPWWKKRLWTH